MRRAARVDGNQGTIVDGLREAGASVYVASSLGRGMADLLVGYERRCYLLEVKDPSKPKSDRQLTPDQVKFRDSWKGHYAVIETLEEALQEIWRI